MKIWFSSWIFLKRLFNNFYNFIYLLLVDILNCNGSWAYCHKNNHWFLHDRAPNWTHFCPDSTIHFTCSIKSRYLPKNKSYLIEFILKISDIFIFLSHGIKWVSNNLSNYRYRESGFISRRIYFEKRLLGTNKVFRKFEYIFISK